MKKRIVFIIAATLLLLSACVPSNQYSGDTNGPSTVPQSSSMLPTAVQLSDTIIDLRNYNSGLDNSKIDTDTIVALLRSADDIMNAYSEFIFTNNEYLDRYAKAGYPNDYEEIVYEDKIVIQSQPEERTKLMQDSLRYFIFLHLLTTEYDDFICDLDYDWDWSTSSRPRFYDLYISSNYKNAGYNTVQSYLKAINDSECEPDSGAFRVSYECVSMKVDGRNHDSLLAEALRQ